ncbi:peroxisome biogenesis protein 19-1-like [Wolffia australiana]
MADASADDLDNLLDSALDDFNKLDLDPVRRGKSGEKLGGAEFSSSLGNSAPVQGLGLGMGLSPLRQSKKKVPQGPKVDRSQPLDASHASEALAMLTQQTQNAFLGLESAFGAQVSQSVEELEKEGMLNDFVKQFEEMAESQDMESLVETMMKQLLSKEILYEPMKEIAGRYPTWLGEHSKELSPEDLQRYQNQYQLILKLNEAYENEPENFPKILEIMQKMQECGQPPADIVQELAPDLDLSTLSQLSSPDNLGPSSNCCIM